MPIAADIATLDREVLRCQARQEFGLDQDAKVLLVSGGSQGAMSLNTAVWEAAQDLASAGVSILHITGAKNISKVPGTVGSSYVPVKYVSGMEKAYAAADMMLARSGAATVTETATVGLPAIYVPLPHGNGEQEKNARGIVDAGGGILVDDHELSAELLVDLVTQLISDPQRLASMGEIARQLIPRDSASLVALEIIDVVRGGG
jgi:UDP-N-acetylglucosamine--N-acetylmuramyl-(pentapeptide) pyrophosphoryl-undecaprenol N-acetylglucosamine transferase